MLNLYNFILCDFFFIKFFLGFYYSLVELLVIIVLSGGVIESGGLFMEGIICVILGWVIVVGYGVYIGWSFFIGRYVGFLVGIFVIMGIWGIFGGIGV